MINSRNMFIVLTFFATIAQGIWSEWLQDEIILVVDLPILAMFFVGKKKLNIPPKAMPFIIFTVIFMLWSHIGFFFAPNRTYLWQETIMNIRTMLIFVVIVFFVNSKEELQNVFLGLALGAFFQGVIAWHQWLRGPVGLGFLGEQRFLSWQAQGTFVHASVFGMYISLMSILNYRMAVFLRPRFHKFYVATFFIGVVALYASLNRATWLAFAISMITMFLVDMVRGNTRHKRARRVLIWVAVAALVGVIRYGPIMVARFNDAEESLTSERSSSRKSLALDALRIISEHPVVGVGLNNYREYVSKETAGTRVVHCSYLLIAAELGWSGLVFFLAVLGSAAWMAIGLMRSSDYYIKHVSAALFTALMSFSIAILPSPDYRILYVKTHIWMILGMIVVAAKLEQQLKTARKPAQVMTKSIKPKKTKIDSGRQGPLLPNIGPRELFSE